MPVVLAVAMALVLATGASAGKVKIRSKADKTFDFRTVHTWAWDDSGEGQVLMMRSADDDPAAVKARFEPTIVAAVGDELTKRGLNQATGKPDVEVTYYLLVTLGSQSQQLGQFVNPNVALRLPPFSGATTDFNVVQEASLVLDVISPAKENTVWRGIASAELNLDSNDDQRKARLRDAIHDLVKKLPSVR
jgi:Domain of unknown function (DUF4136)